MAEVQTWSGISEKLKLVHPFFLLVIPVCWVVYTLCPQKSIPDIFCCNLKTNYQILIIFGTNNRDKTCHQMTIQFPTSSNVCFCTTWGETQPAKYHFYPMQYDCSINTTRKNAFCLHFWHLGAVKLLEVLAHYANAGKEMLSPFIDNSVDNVLLQSNPGCNSCFLTYKHS